MAILWAVANYFRVPGRLLGPVTLGTWFKRRNQKLIVIAFYGYFVVYRKLFLGPGAIYRARDTRYMVSEAAPKLVVFAFYGRFVGCCTLAWGPGAIFWARDTRYMV
jgi:hypothetical protein